MCVLGCVCVYVLGYVYVCVCVCEKEKMGWAERRSERKKVKEFSFCPIQVM